MNDADDAGLAGPVVSDQADLFAVRKHEVQVANEGRSPNVIVNLLTCNIVRTFLISPRRRNGERSAPCDAPGQKNENHRLYAGLWSVGSRTVSKNP